MVSAPAAARAGRAAAGHTHTREIVIPYAPRPVQLEIHGALERHRFCVIVAHRRLGKTVCAINHLIKTAIVCRRREGHFAYIAPLRNQAKNIAWSYLKHFTGRIPGRTVNETELAVTLPTGAGIRLYGADNPDALRGIYLDGAVLDEVAQMKPEVWGEIIRPALSDRQGYAAFIGTPKGQNLFYELYVRACRTAGWFAGVWRVDQTRVLPETELAAVREELSDAQYRQEFLCDFTASSDDVLIPIDLADEASRRTIMPGDVAGAEKIIGVDVARFGDDLSVLAPRQGLYGHPLRVFRGLDNMELADHIAGLIHEFDPDAVCIDAGAGAGVIDALGRQGYRDLVLEVHFGGKPLEELKYFNKRAEMYGRCLGWLKGGGRLPDDPDLRTDLTLPRYGYDDRSRIKLEGKDRIKERAGRSPDRADAFVLTFAANVRPRRRGPAAYQGWGAGGFGDGDQAYNPLA